MVYTQHVFQVSMDVIKTEPDSVESVNKLVDENGEEDPLAVPSPEAEVSSAEIVLQSKNIVLFLLYGVFYE